MMMKQVVYQQRTAFLLFLLLHCCSTVLAAPLFAYQTNSAKSFEYSENGWHNPDDIYDPSSFPGSVRYDERHHALFITGATYSSLLDGVDAYLVNEEKSQLEDNNSNNDGFWWNDKQTGLHPHMGDPGIPGYSPKTGDCFYAVMALPSDNNVAGSGVGSKPKLVHSRRFGSENILEACSASDILFSDEVDDGQYIHGFEEQSAVGIPQQQPSPAAAIPSPTYQQQQQQQQQYGDTFSKDEVSFPSNSPSSATYDPTGSNYPSASPSSATYDPTVSSESGGSDFFGGGKNRERRSLLETRSVRLLMAGHVESTNGRDGYTVNALASENKRDGTHVYAFAQGVDIRLPSGFLSDVVLNSEEDAEYEYNLDEHATAFDPPDKTEDEWINQSQGQLEQLMNDQAGKSVEQIQNEFANIVTSGVDARALVDDGLPSYLNTVYPVSLVADPTTKKHFYVASLASRDVVQNEQNDKNGLHVDPTIGDGASQKSWTGFIDAGNQKQETDYFGGPQGRPNYGKDYLVVLKKVAIENVNPECIDSSGMMGDCPKGISNSEKILSAKDYNEKNIVMREEWIQEYEPEGGADVRSSGLLFAPSGDPTGNGDTLIMVGTTAGFGNAFGASGGDDGYQSQDSIVGQDLDGFVMRIRVGDGEFAGHSKFDPGTSTFKNMHSHRIQSKPRKDDVIAGLCSKPLQLTGNQEQMKYFYIVGSTESELPKIRTGLRDANFLSDHPVQDGKKSMEAFLMKIDLATLAPLWTIQLGAIYADGVNMKGSAYGLGCSVTPDGDDIYLTGIVNQGGLATDFSAQDSQGIPATPRGGTDVFIASYKTSDGSRNFVRQIGSSRDDFPSRGNGGITADRFGNAILTGHTRGSIARKRDSAEYKYGASGSDAAADIFVMSFDRATGNHIEIIDDDVAPSVVTSTSSPNQQKVDKQDAAILGVVATTLCFIFVAIAGIGIVVYKIKAGKKKQAERRFRSTNLRERGQGDTRSMRRRSTWGMRRQGSALSALQDLNVMVEVRNSASGGWHGIYDDEQLQVIDFGMSTGYKDNVVEQSLFMEDDLKEIEEASNHNPTLDSYEIGDLEDVSDEDLIKAYNDAMAVDIEPENPEVQFAMASLGSHVLDDDHHIT
jgi:hypothetical protein